MRHSKMASTEVRALANTEIEDVSGAGRTAFAYVSGLSSVVWSRGDYQRDERGLVYQPQYNIFGTEIRRQYIH